MKMGKGVFKAFLPLGLPALTAIQSDERLDNGESCRCKTVRGVQRVRFPFVAGRSRWVTFFLRYVHSRFVCGGDSIWSEFSQAR